MWTVEQRQIYDRTGLRYPSDLTDAGIPHVYDYYGAGTHTFAYWARDLMKWVA